MAKIVLFGGTFDPIHLGHINIARLALNKIKADFCIFIIAKNPRWKIPSIDSKKRVELLELALKDEDKFKISYVEINSDDEINYTYDTIKRHFYNGKDELYYLIGSDQEVKLHNWYKIDELAKMVHFLIYKRDGFEINIANLNRYNCTLLEGEYNMISSSEIREGKRLYTKKKVIDKIVQDDLYFMKDLLKFMSKKRLNHVISVANLSYEIAKRNNLDKEKAYLSGLYHDIAREMDMNKQIEYMEKYYKEYMTYNKELYHQYVAIPLLKEVFNIEDKEILNAIECHTTGKENMSPLDMILYSSDKIEPTRNYDSSRLIECCLNDYYNGFIEVLKENKLYFKKKNISIDNPNTKKCFKYYLKENEDGRD